VCDTLVALPNSTREGVTIFAKNSDREPNEAQVVEFIPRTRHDEEYVQCTYVKVPQVRETYAVVISRPYWMWGAEMGVNEHGVAIGNEAVFTRLPYAKTGLTGMDMLRLALERSRTAREALDLIIALLEEYGQGGNCSATGKLYYHNSFIIADPREAWVLETAGRFWVAERVRDVRSISNALSIERGWDMASKGVVEHAVERGWCKGEEDFSFARCYSDRLYTSVAKGRERQRFTQTLLRENVGRIDFELVSRVMRAHSFEENYAPSRGSMRDICMHAGGPTRPSQTAGSMIALLHEKCPVVWVTATSSPCISLYKPVFLEAGVPDLGPMPRGVYDPETYWWRHEKLHRLLLHSYPKYAGGIRGDVLEAERKLVEEAARLREAYLEGKAGVEELRELSSRAFRLGAAIDEKWVKLVKPGRGLNPLFAAYWYRVNRQARLR
jgi:dipeptidase